MGESKKPGNRDNLLLRIFPFLEWFPGYNAAKLRADLIAGLTVALVLVPQSMAYAQLAGLPAYYGLYAAFLPPIVASLFGSSHQLATGPVAIVSLMTATALEPLATAGSPEYCAYAVLLALLVGAFQFSLGVLRLGLLVNLLSHPVVTGFTNAGALIIATSQLSKLFGVNVDKAEHHYETVINVVKAALQYTHWPTLAIGTMAFAVMIGLKRINRKIPYVLVAALIATVISYVTKFEKKREVDLDQIDSASVQTEIRTINSALRNIEDDSSRRRQLGARLREMQSDGAAHPSETMRLRHEIALLILDIREKKEAATKMRHKLRSHLFTGIADGEGGFRLVLRSEAAGRQSDGKVWRLKVGNGELKEDALPVTAGGAVVGSIPPGLPKISLPTIDFGIASELILIAMVISLLGFMEAISIAKAMAARTSQRIDANQELIGQGLGNILGSFGLSYPVSGSFSRSAVNLEAGGVTGVSNVVSSLVVIVTLLFLTPLLYHLPQAVLAAIIMMAVLGLINVKAFVHHWKANRSCGFVAVTTFVATLLFAPHLDRGIFIGILLTIGFFLFQTMRPAIAVLSKHPDGSFRNAQRFGLETCRHIAVIRFNGSLFFASVNYLEETILERVATMPEVKHVLIVGNGINQMDSSGDEMLSKLVTRLRDAGYRMSMSGCNDAVIDVLKRTGLYDNIGKDNFYPNVATAVSVICLEMDDCLQADECPLKYVRFKDPVKLGAK